MYVVVRHTIGDPATAFARGQRLISGEGAPPGVRPLQFYPSEDRSLVTCLIEAEAVSHSWTMTVNSFVDADAQKPVAAASVTTSPIASVDFAVEPHGVAGTSTSAESDFPPAVATM